MRYFAKHWYKTTACLTTIFTAFPLFAQPIENIPTSHYELEKIIIFSRHGLRSPLTEKGSDLEKSTP